MLGYPSSGTVTDGVDVKWGIVKARCLIAMIGHACASGTPACRSLRKGDVPVVRFGTLRRQINGRSGRLLRCFRPHRSLSTAMMGCCRRDEKRQSGSVQPAKSAKQATVGQPCQPKQRTHA